MYAQKRDREKHWGEEKVKQLDQNRVRWENICSMFLLRILEIKKKKNRNQNKIPYVHLYKSQENQKIDSMFVLLHNILDSRTCLYSTNLSEKYISKIL